jgi:hypothetical protein
VPTHVDGTLAAKALRTKSAYVHNSSTIAIKGKVAPVHDIRHIGEAEVELQSFLTSALDGGE